MAFILAQLAQNELEARLNKKNILVVGGTAGIGRAITHSFLKRGARVTIVGRRAPDDTLSGATFVQKDLGLMKNAATLVDDVDPTSFDTILFTNGIFAAPERQETSEGLEKDLAVSTLSRYVIIDKFMAKGFGSKSKGTSKPRVFVMGYPGGDTTATLDDFNSEKAYSAWPSHMNTVVGNEALVTHINTASKGTINSYGLNPGLIKTEIRDNFLGEGSWKSSIIETVIGWFTPTAEQYAEKHLVHIITSPELEDKPGVMIDNKRKIIPPNTFLTPANLQKVISESQKLVDRALSSKKPL